MPLIRPSVPPPAKAEPGTEEQLASAIEDLSSATAESRWNAARRLSGRAEALSALAAALGVEKVPRVQEAIMTALLSIGSEESVRTLLPCLQSQDAGLRAAAIDALQALPAAISPFLESLLADSDSDVRILATELARNIPVAEATRLLCGLLQHEQHPNVCAAAMELLADVGTRDAVPALQSCAERFAAIPFLRFAAATAIARITDSGG
jgi:HEAT repeat protein